MLEKGYGSFSGCVLGSGFLENYDRGSQGQVVDGVSHRCFKGDAAMCERVAVPSAMEQVAAPFAHIGSCLGHAF